MIALTVLLAVVAASVVAAADAHTTVEVPPYEIEAGWGTEPPIVGLRNTVVYSVTEAGGSEGIKRGVAGAFSDIDVTLRFGGLEQPAEAQLDIRPGHYFTKIIPTRIGSYSVGLAGEIGGTGVDVTIPIEDVMATSALDFPPRAGSGGDADVEAIKNSLASLRQQLEAGTASAPAADGGAAYDIALFAAAFGAAGTVLAVVSMIKRR